MINVDQVKLSAMLLPILFAFLQICFIPGFIAYILLIRKSDNPKLLLMPVFSFGLSLLINYLIVICLVYFHLYTRGALIFIIAIELILLAGIAITGKANLRAFNFRKNWIDIKYEISLMIKGHNSFYPVRLILFFLSVLLLLFLLRVLIVDAGKVFEQSDAVFSWNRWAIDFFNNKLPYSTYHYPQLIPANWSIAYVLCEYPLQFIPRIIMHLFLILQVYSFIVLGFTQRSTFFYITAFIIYLGLSSRGFFWTDGFVDVSVSFFGIMAYISLVSIKTDDAGTDKMKFVLMSILFVCGAAVTKQAGLFILFFYPVLHYILLRDKLDWTRKNVSVIIIFYCISFLLIVLPYYLWAEMAIKNGNAASEIAYVTHDIYKGASYPERFFNALQIFENVFNGKVLLIFFTIFYLVSFSNKTLCYINLCFTIPYFLIWALFFSYDIRNVSIIIPYFSLGIAYGLQFLTDRLPLLFEFFKRLRIKWPDVGFTIRIFFLIMAAASAILLNANLSMERLKRSQDFRLKRLGDEEVNEKLYLFKSTDSINRKIITDYHYLKLLPEIGQYFQYGLIQDMDSTSAIIQDESVGFLLWNPWYADSTKFPAFIDTSIQSGLYKEIFEHNGFRFIKIR